MLKERLGLLSIGGQEVAIFGDDVIVGQKAPEFKAQTFKWENIDVLSATRGKVRILAALPSIETGVCDRETRKFNEEAADLDDNIVIIPISTDLPYTQANWCGAAGIERVMMVSDHQDTSFGLNYGCLVKERRILRRAIFVVDQQDTICYAAYMPTLGDEPDYKEVIAVAKNVLS